MSGGRCHGKIGYVSEVLAQQESRRLHRQQPGEHFSVYQCAVCRQWHVGHSPGQRGRTVRPVESHVEQDGEYRELVRKTLHVQAVLSEVNESRPFGWQTKRRMLIGELAAAQDRMQEIKQLRRQQHVKVRIV